MRKGKCRLDEYFLLIRVMRPMFSNNLYFDNLFSESLVN